MDTSEVANVTLPVQLLRNNSESCSLLEIETRWGDEIACGQEVGKFCSNVEVYFAQDLLEIFYCEENQKSKHHGPDVFLLSLKSTTTPFRTSRVMLLRI